MQQQLDPSATYRRKLAQYSLYGHHGRGDKETEEDDVGRSEEEEKLLSRDRNRVSLRLALTRWARTKNYKRMQVTCRADLLSVGLVSKNVLAVLLCLVLHLLDVWLC